MYNFCVFKYFVGILGQNLVFEIDKKLAFEIPLSNVSHCGGGSKSEVSLEFHVNEDCPVQLVEMRLHVPQDGDKTDADVDEVEVLCAVDILLHKSLL